MTEYHQVIGTGAIESVNKNKTSDYDIKMDLDVANIDKNNNNAWGTIYEAIDEHWFGEVKIFPKKFINLCKKYLNESQNITDDTKNNLKQLHWKKVYMHRWQGFVINVWLRRKIPGKPKIKYLFQGKYLR